MRRTPFISLIYNKERESSYRTLCWQWEILTDMPFSNFWLITNCDTGFTNAFGMSLKLIQVLVAIVKNYFCSDNSETDFWINRMEGLILKNGTLLAEHETIVQTNLRLSWFPYPILNISVVSLSSNLNSLNVLSTLS